MKDYTTTYKIIKILACIGILLAIYLLWQQFFRPALQPCNINDLINCNAIIKGEVSKVLGIPTPLIGFTGYIIILISAFLKKKKLLVAMSTFGLLFCLGLGVIELFFLHVICPVCITCQVVMIAIWALGLKIYLDR